MTQIISFIKQIVLFTPFKLLCKSLFCLIKLFGLMFAAPGPWLPSKLLPIFPVTSQAQSPECSSLSLASGSLQQRTLVDDIIMSFPRTKTKFASHLVESSRCLKHTQYFCSIHLGHPCTFSQAWARCRLQIWPRQLAVLQSYSPVPLRQKLSFAAYMQ